MMRDKFFYFLLMICYLISSSNMCLANSNKNIDISSTSSYVWPVSGVITADYGHRICPYHGPEFHPGLDIAVEFNTPVQATASGTVIYAAWMGGYGNCVMVDHRNGITSLYGHNSSFPSNIINGVTVSQGQTIAFAGSTGNSTGPHVHFELRTANGGYLDPSKVLSGSMPVADVFGEPDVALPWGIENMYQIGDEINKQMKHFATLSDIALGYLTPVALWLLSILAIIDLTIPIFLSGMAFSWRQSIVKILKYCFLFLVITRWSDIFINNVFLDIVISTSGTLTNDPTVIGQNISQPQLVLQKAIQMITPALNVIADMGSITFLNNLFKIIIIYIFSFLTMGAYILLALYTALIYIEFYISAALNIFTIPFHSTKFTKFIPEGTLGHLWTNTVRLLTISVMICFMHDIVKNQTPTTIFQGVNILNPITNGIILQYIVMCLGLIALALLTIKVVSSIAGILGGSFELSS
jgi:hypothetical protein